MKRIRVGFHIMLCLALLLVGGLLPSGTLWAQTEADYVPGEIVVKLWFATDLAAVANQYELRLPAIDQFGSRPIYRLGIADDVSPLDKAEAMAGDSRVRFVEPNYLNYTPEGQKQSSWARVEGVTDYAIQWAVDQIRLPEAHVRQRGAGMIVAVLDTGVDATHPALAGRLVAGYDFVDLDPDPSEMGIAGQDLTYGHGTHVAGIVAVSAPDAKIMPLRVLDRNGAGNLWVLAEALAYAVDPDGNPATDDGADVINLSLSTRRPTALLDEIIDSVTCEDDEDEEDEDDDDEDEEDEDDEDDDCRVGRKGAVVVAAAGNNSSSTLEYPAAEGNLGLLAIAATTPADTLASFSNYGAWVHLAAPGETIISAVPENQSGAWSGTSMAAPFVAGVAALVKASNPTLTPAQVTQHLQSSAVTIGGEVPRRIDAALAIPSYSSFLPLIQVNSDSKSAKAAACD